MRSRRISGILCLLIGIGLLVYGFYVKYQMADARKQISSASAESFLPDTPLTRPFTDPVTKNPITKGIEEREKEKYYRRVDAYEPLALALFIGGGIFIAIGIILLALPRKKS